MLLVVKSFNSAVANFRFDDMVKMKSKLKMMLYLSLTIIFVGFFSIFSQSLFIRELLVIFYGNELTSGILLSGWLFFGGLGSFFFSKLSRRIKDIFSFFTISLVIFSLFSFFQIFLIKNLRSILGVYPGEIISPLSVILSSVFILAPFAFTNGFLFSCGVQLYSQKKKAESPGKVYALDALGDTLGALAFSFFFVYAFVALENIYFVSLALLIAAFLFSLLYCKKPGLKFIIAFLIILFLPVGLKLKSIDYSLTRKEWKGFEVVEKVSSIYADSVLTRKGSLYSLFENGILSFSFPLRTHSEEVVHFSLLQVENPERVLVIGAGMSGLLHEILKYQEVSEVYYLELDPDLIDMVRKYLPAEDRLALESSKVKLINLEARNFLNFYKGGKFDVIILNTQTPLNLYLNRFYTGEFFRKIRYVLKKEGVFSFSLPSKEGYLSKELRGLTGSIYWTLKEVFPRMVLIPGDRLRFIASSSLYLSEAPEELSRRLKTKGISNQYVNEHYFYSRLLPWHLNYIKNILENYQEVRLNYDFEPTAYFYGINYYASHFGSELVRIFSVLSKVKMPFYLIISLVILLLTLVLRKNFVLPLSVFTMGFAGICNVIIFIVGFQTIYGFVYHKVGLISACFMSGAALGANVFSVSVGEKKNSFRLFLICTFSGIFFVLLPWFLNFFSEHSHSVFQAAFFILPAVFGFFTGGFFALANRRYLVKKSIPEKAGILYAFDLAGGALGGIIISLVFLPLYGIINSCNFIGIFLILTALILRLSLKLKP